MAIMASRNDIGSEFVTLFLTGGIIVSLLPLCQYLVIKTFVFTEDRLSIKTSAGLPLLPNTIRRDSIRRIIEVQQRSPGNRIGAEEYPPQWLLFLDGKFETYLLQNQTVEATSWLGPIVAQWAGVPFIPYEGYTEHKFGINPRGLEHPWPTR